MKPNYKIVKELIAQHMKVCKLMDTLAEADIEIPTLERLDLLNVALDIIGYPSKEHLRIVSKGTEMRVDSDAYIRESWEDEADNIKMEDIDSFLERLYDEYNQLLVKKPHLFVKG